MKKIYLVITVLLAALSFTGCRQMEEPGPKVAGSVLLKGVLESQPKTKTYIGTPDDKGIYRPYWSEKDAIAVYVDGINKADKYTLSSGSGSVSGEFYGTVQGMDKVALYPYDYKNGDGLKGNILSLTLPEKQSYAEGTFADGAFPMVAVSNSDVLSFKNLCAVLRVSMTGDVAVQSVKFVAHDSWMPVSGKATVRTDFQDEPELVMVDDGLNEVTLQCDYIPLDPTKPTDFFLVIPPGTYRNGFSLEIKTFKGTVTRTTNADIVFKRSQVRSVPVFECNADGEIDPDDIPYNEIWYTTNNNRRIYFNAGDFDKGIVSNTYADGKGIIVFDGPVTSIGEQAFAVSSLSGISLPNSIETIAPDAFNNSAIASFHTPRNLKSVGDYAFYCERLRRIYGSHASSDEKALVLDGRMVAYARGALDTDLVIPDGVQAIARSLFSGCNKLLTASFPESVNTVEEDAFYGCTMLRELRGNNEHIPDGRAFINDDGHLAVWAGYGAVDYVVPESVGTFDYRTFSDNKTLHSLTFPPLKFSNIWLTDYFRGCDNLEFFYGENATSDNHGLIIWGNRLFAMTKVLPKEYTFPSGYGIARTNPYLFSGISTVEHLILPDDILVLNDRTFRNMANLKSIRLPAGLASLGYNEFEGCDKLRTVYLRSFSPPTYEERDGYEGFAHDGLVIYVPSGSEDVYKKSDSWSKYADYIQGYQYDDLESPDYYISKDFSQDGKVTTLQRATSGAGIDLVLMGDGFTDVQIADGTYGSYMEKMAEAFFSEEPYTSLRSMFNVYAVNVVSYTEGYEHPGQALGGWFGDGTQVGGNDSKCMEYARNIVGDERMNNVLIIVAMNATKHAGTCWMYHPSSGDYGIGTSVAYFPVGEDDEGLARLVHHEAGGHGFAKLDDEYAYEGTISQDEVEEHQRMAQFGWWKNVDFTPDPSKVKWSKFLTDSRYAYDGLGVFEGASTYSKGAWRPTENSIMRHNTGGFNAPSREAIWYRAHKLAYGESWEYDYEAFVTYDAKNRKTSASAAEARGTYLERPMPPLHPPVVIHRRWNDPAPETVSR